MIKRIASFFQQEKITFSFLFIFSGLALGVILCFICIAFYALSLSRGNSTAVLATLFMVTCASYLIGNAFGFLFGIPKTMQERDGMKPENRISYQINTNLEQISDWLTKMLVGAGLVEFKELVKFLVNISTDISADIGHPNAQSIIIASILCFAILGFFITYFGTRLYIANALASANTELQGISEEK